MRILKTLLIITLYELSKYVTNEIIIKLQANDAVDQYPTDYEVSEMNINITILSCIIIYLVISKVMQRSEIKSLRDKLEHKSKKVNEIIVDNKNKIVVLHVENGMLTHDMREDINKNFQGLKDKGYYVIALDKTFNVMEKHFSQELAHKFRSEITSKEDE